MGTASEPTPSSSRGATGKLGCDLGRCGPNSVQGAAVRASFGLMTMRPETPAPPMGRAPGEPIPRRFRGSIPASLFQGRRNNDLDMLKDDNDVMGSLIECLENMQTFLRVQQSILVSTVDTMVYEHLTVPIPAGVQSFSLDVPAQTRQLERIDSVFCAITAPALNQDGITTAPVVTLDNAYAQLGEDYVNLNAILNSSAGTGGTIPSKLGYLLNADDIRSFNVHATAVFPAGLYMTAVLTGATIPATLGEANV